MRSTSISETRFGPGLLARCAVAALLLAVGSAAHAWGNEGHRVIALIAWHYLSPAQRREIDTLLQRDRSGLTATDFASEATWADAYRDSDRNSSRVRYEHTRRWHYINLELTQPDIDRACYGSKPLPPGEDASEGPARDCVVDKVEQFDAEFHAARTAPAERLRALQFLIHFVGDLHQPLHAADNDDNGGNLVRVEARNYPHGTLHGYWDYAVVARLGRDPAAVARRLVTRIDPRQLADWRHGTPRDWALASFAVARDIAYGKLPPPDHSGVHILGAAYAAAAKTATAQQLSAAGVRLAWLLQSPTQPP